MTSAPRQNPEVMTLIGQLHLTWKRHVQKAVVGHGITLKQFHVLRRLDEEGFLRPAAVADELFCDRPTASVILGNMQKQGWISRTKDPANRKRVRIRLLAAGRKKRARIRALPELNERFDFDPLRGFSAADARAFVAFLKRLDERVADHVKDD